MRIYNNQSFTCPAYTGTLALMHMTINMHARVRMFTRELSSNNINTAYYP